MEETRANSKSEKEHVTDLVGLSRLHGLEESSLMNWVFELGEEEGLMRAIDEKLGTSTFEMESVVSEVPWQGDFLQVLPRVSLQPTEKEEVRFLFRGGWEAAEPW